MKKLIFLFFLYAFWGYSFESAESFVVTIHPDYVQVLSPVKEDKTMQLVIVNKTLSNIVSRLSLEDGTVLKSIKMIAPQKSVTVSFSLDEKKKVFFMMLSPAFQEVLLDKGKKSYRIPPEIIK